jgi:hypothetical protein
MGVFVGGIDVDVVAGMTVGVAVASGVLVDSRGVQVDEAAPSVSVVSVGCASWSASSVTERRYGVGVPFGKCGVGGSTPGGGSPEW